MKDTLENLFCVAAGIVNLITCFIHGLGRLSQWYGIEIGPVGGKKLSKSTVFLTGHVLISEPVASFSK